MTKLNWQPFELGEVFNIRASNSGIDKNKLKELEGDVPYITRTELNNGVGDYVGEEQKTVYKKDDGNVITIGLDTQTVHYQPTSFYTGQNIQILEHKHLNEQVAHFIIPLLKVLMGKFSWGSTGATLTRLKRSKIVMPVKDDGTPDWAYMEQQSKMKQIHSRRKIIDFLNKELVKIGKYNTVFLKDVKWKAFNIEDIAIVKSGNDWTYKDRKRGNVPFIGASSIGNGVTDYVNPDSKPKYVAKGAISINRNGSIGYSFYHPYEAYFSGDTRFIKIKAENEASEYSSIFIKKAIEKQRYKYMYGYKMGTERIKKQSLMLPVTLNGEPDYDFMNNYIKGLKYNSITAAIDFLN